MPPLPLINVAQNYGDEPGAYSLLYPSLYSNMGLYGEDFFAYRPQEEVGPAQYKGSDVKVA